MKKKYLGLIILTLLGISICCIFLIGNVDLEVPEMSVYGYEEKGDITDDWYPINTHLCIEHGGYVYFVPFQNTLTIRKLNPSDQTSSLIVTEGGAITKFYLDRTGEKLYYYHAQSTFSYVDLTDDSITDLDDTLNACEDLFIYDSSLFAVDTSQDDLTFYKYTAGAPGSWGAVGTIAEGKTNSFDIGALGGNDGPLTMTFDGTYFYIVDTDGYIYKYNSALDTLVDSIDIGSIGAGNDVPKGITSDGTYFYVTDTDGYIYKYNSALDTLIGSFNIASLGGNDKPVGLIWKDPYFYVVDYDDAIVYKYPSDFSEITDSYNIGALGGNDEPNDIEWDGYFFYLIDVTDGYVYKYNEDLTILINSFNINALCGNNNPTGIAWDGNFFYTTDVIQAYVYKYNSDIITELGKILYTTIISNNAYLIYQYITGDCKVYVKDLDNSNNPTLLETISSDYIIPYLESQRGVSVSSDNDTLYFVLKDTTDGLTYLCTYAITADTFTVLGEYNVALMLDRNTDSSNDIPFNLEKGFGVEAGVNSLMAYQISRAGKSLYKIADLTTLVADGTIVAITDTYLIILRDDTTTELWKFQDMSDYIFGEPFENGIIHAERDYPTAMLKYREDKYYLSEGMFVQIIGPVRVNGSTTALGVQFEGYALKPEDEDDGSIVIKTVDLVNPSYFDLRNSYAGTLASGGFDDWLDTIVSSFNYIIKGTFDAATLTLEEYERDSEKSNAIFMDQGAIGEEFTWRIRPTGELDWTAGDDDSGLNYSQDTPIWDVEVSKKITVPNSITVKGGFFGGSQISSDSDHGQDLVSQQANGPIEEEFTFAWISSVATANLYADALLNTIGTVYTEVRFKVQDFTNGFVPSAEEITLEYTPKDITSAQYKINKVTYDFKNGIAEYIVSSIVRWDIEDLKGSHENELADQVVQINDNVETLDTKVDTLISNEAWDGVGGSFDGVTTIGLSKNVFDDAILDEDDMTSDSDVHLATQQSIKKYIDDSISICLNYNNYIQIQYHRTQGTAGGTFTSGAWRTRPLDTIEADIGDNCSLASNQITLEAGTYYFTAWATVYAVNRHMLKLYNVTDAVDIKKGSSNMAHPSYGGVDKALLSGIFTIGAGKALELRHKCITTNNGDGMGLETNLDEETYANIEFFKVG
jgi:hypothetical protein